MMLAFVGVSLATCPQRHSIAELVHPDEREDVFKLQKLTRPSCLTQAFVNGKNANEDHRRSNDPRN